MTGERGGEALSEEKQTAALKADLPANPSHNRVSIIRMLEALKTQFV